MAHRLPAAALLLALLAGGVAAAPEFSGDLREAQARALAAGKPVLVLLLRDGNRDSERLLRLLSSPGPVADRLGSFVLVRAGAKDREEIAERYDLKTLPATLFLSYRGIPVKLVGGVLSPARYAEAMDDVLEKNRQQRSPSRREAPEPRPAVPPRPERVFDHAPDCPDGCPACEEAAARALSWLATRQQADGRFAKQADEVVAKTPDGRILTRSIDHVETALTAVAGLAFLAGGSTLAEGPHRQVLARAARFLESAVRPDGIVCAETGNDYLYLTQCNFETGLAAMFLAEIQALAPDAARAEKMARVAGYLSRVQDPACGAWGYSHDFNDTPADVKRGWRLLATTHCALGGLLWLGAAGIPVDGEAVARGVRYLQSCRARGGLFGYRAEFRHLPGYPGATAGALVSLRRSGLLKEGDLGAIGRTWRPVFADIEGYGRHFWFFLLHTALAMRDEGEEGAREFHRRFRDRVLSAQEEDGSFADPDAAGGRVFATAAAAFALTHHAARLRIAGATPPAAMPPPAERPSYLAPAHPTSRVKVYEQAGLYRYDLVVSTDGPADREWFAAFGRAIEGANRLLWDATNGQICLGRATLAAEKARWDEADVRVVTDFYSNEPLPQPFVHGLTIVSQRTTIRGSREKTGPRIGDWVMLPWAPRGGGEPFPWDNPKLTRVLAHELAHYLFGLLDEYDERTGESRCDCLLGSRTSTEFCTAESHRDPRVEEACWDHALALYPRLKAPHAEDPGPWEPPPPRINLP